MAIAVETLISPDIARPARYLGNELGAVHKPWTAAEVRWVLTYPEIYEVGASNLGHIILYSTSFTSSSEAIPESVTTTWLYPNPVVRGQPLHFAAEVQTVQVYDLQGRMILNSPNNTIPTAALPVSGLYLLRLQPPSGTRIEKLVEL